MFRTNLSLTYLGSCAVLLEYGDLRVVTEPGLAVSRGLAPFETCLMSSVTGASLLITATPGRRTRAPRSPVDTLGFALGRDRPGDLFYATGRSVWCDEMATVADCFSPKVIFTTMEGEGLINVSRAFPDAVITVAVDDQSDEARPRLKDMGRPITRDERPPGLRLLYPGKKLCFNIAA
ncbi:hypothetical protein [Luteibacter aegosomatissinici]|uniref:hypothetical protein n=1 Tax=Luteibacter aegosomatissinici TaxID=2911539 RepID=UPI001FFB06B1|nr:hypothetical protein [Luteibacter aegosomatissinici]UPG94548.1 hypothetical protein L2Y97_00140 [Luteibacter aegosomatissinici]